ncbi:hypothetical protein C8T65DRAFT_701052 [Cerioporus squamosus]|nr:hypothetical protein C8T65DRAFT_701052 [Cerioporus squamosus]
MYLSPRASRSSSSLRGSGRGKLPSGSSKAADVTAEPCFAVTEVGNPCLCPDFVPKKKGGDKCRSCGHSRRFHTSSKGESSLDSIPEEDDDDDLAAVEGTAGSAPASFFPALSFTQHPSAGPSASQAQPAPHAEQESISEVIARVKSTPSAKSTTSTKAFSSTGVSKSQAHQEAVEGFRPTAGSVGPVRRTRPGHRSAQAASGSAQNRRASKTAAVGQVTLLPYGMSETSESTLEVPDFEINNQKYPTKVETERLRAAGFVCGSMPDTGEPIVIHGTWTTAEINTFLRRLFPRIYELMDALDGPNDGSSLRQSHVALCMRDFRKLIPMHADGITGNDLIRVRSGTGHSNQVSNLHFVTRLPIEPGIYKNLTEALAHVKDGTFPQYLAEVMGESDDTAATVMDSELEQPYANMIDNASDVEAPPSATQPRNKGKGVVARKLRKSLFALSSSDDYDSADDFFLSSGKPSASQKTSVPVRQSQRLADKTSITTASKASSSTATYSKKRLRSPSPAGQSSKRIRMGSADEPIVIPSDDEWFPLFMGNTEPSATSSSTIASLLRKPEGLPTPNKIKNDPWAALNNNDPAGKN